MVETENCSKAVYDILQAFNDLPSLAEQEEVLDVIYDALYNRLVREVLSESILAEKKAVIRELKIENEDLRTMLKEKNVALQQLEVSNSKKGLRNTKKALLIIINNLKHYLGDSWQTIFPGGSASVDRYLREIDTNGVMSQDTWSIDEEDTAEKGPC